MRETERKQQKNTEREREREIDKVISLILDS